MRLADVIERMIWMLLLLAFCLIVAPGRAIAVAAVPGQLIPLGTSFVDLTARQYEVRDGYELFVAPSAAESAAASSHPRFASMSSEFEEVRRRVVPSVTRIDRRQVLCVIDASPSPSEVLGASWVLTSFDPGRCRALAQAFNAGNGVASSRMYLVEVTLLELSYEKVATLYDASWRSLGHRVADGGETVQMVDWTINLLIMRALIRDVARVINPIVVS